jgi:hypothetical protein
MFATYLLATYFNFRVLCCANMFKLAGAGQFAETDQNSKHGQDASRRWAPRPGGPDCDANCVLPSTQTDQDGPFASVGCVGPLEMP